MLKNYEMIFIVHPNVPEEETPAVADKLTTIITQHKGEVVALKNWGKKKFAHKIKKSTRGYYFLLYFLATPAVLAELERVLRYDEKILRYQTVRSRKEEFEALRKEGDGKDQEGAEDSTPLSEEAPVKE